MEELIKKIDKVTAKLGLGDSARLDCIIEDLTEDWLLGVITDVELLQQLETKFG